MRIGCGVCNRGFQLLGKRGWRRLVQAVLLPAVLLAASPGRAASPSNAPFDLDSVYRQLEHNYRRSDAAETEVYGAQALSMRGEARLYALWTVLYVYKSHMADDRLADWIERTRAAASRDGDGDLERLADLFARALQAHRQGHRAEEVDWLDFTRSTQPDIRLMALLEQGGYYQSQGQWAEAAEILLNGLTESERRGPAARPLQAEFHQTYGSVLSDLGYIDGALQQTLAASSIDAQAKLPTEDLHRIYDLANVALQGGDLDVADRLARLHYRLAQLSGAPKPRYWTRYLCSAVASQRREWSRIMFCLDPLASQLEQPSTAAQADMIRYRALARARLGDAAGAQADLDELTRLPDGIAADPHALDQVRAYIQDARAHDKQAFEQIDQWWRRDSELTETLHRRTIAQVVRALEGELRQREVKAKELTRAVELSHWLNVAVAIVAALLILLVLGALTWGLHLKRLSRLLRESARAAEAASIAKSTFLATISHEIRTPMNGVLGMAQVLSRGGLSREQQDCVDVISRSGESLLSILNDVLDISKIEAGRLEFEKIVFDMDELVRQTCDDYNQIFVEKGLVLKHASTLSGCSFRGDPTRIRQILRNLISNALKFTLEGEVTVAIDAIDGGVRLVVSDTGIGMSPSVAKTLFARFAQGDGSITRRFGGTGLGLAICRELAEAMRGTIAVESTEGEGSIFRVELALEAATAPAAAHPEPKTATQGPGDARLRVLAAEDNPINQLVLKTLLSGLEVDLTLVENGAMAVDASEAATYDIILMDVQMPVMDGPTASRLIRSREAANGRPPVPIVALTANVMTHQIAEYAAAGMNAHVAKPIQIAQLIEVMSDILNSPEAGNNYTVIEEGSARVA